MPSETESRLQSIERLLHVVVFLLGVGIVVLGDAVTAIRGHGGPVPGIAQLIGAGVAIGAVVTYSQR